MPKFIRIRRFMQALFDEETMADKAAEIGQAMLAVRSLRLTDIAAKMRGSSDASYKQVQKSRLSSRQVFISGCCQPVTLPRELPTPASGQPNNTRRLR